MPIVAPWAISEPLSSDGRVNLNCQLVPFTYIKRETSLHGVFRSTKIPARSTPTTTSRLHLDAEETLKGFRKRFSDHGGCFKTASELCEMFLIPEGATLAGMEEGNPDSWWWRGYLATGDNLREQPYGHIYPRITSRSNTFAVHYRVQVLGGGQSDPLVWSERPDGIIREQRGFSVIERYIEPGDPTLPDFAKTPNATLDAHYKFRIRPQQTFRQ